MMLLERRLNRIEFPALLEALNSGDRCAVRLYREHRARLHRNSVDENRAGAATRGVTPDMGAGELVVGANVVDEKRPGFNVASVVSPVTGDADFQDLTLRLA